MKFFVQTALTMLSSLDLKIRAYATFPIVKYLTLKQILTYTLIIHPFHFVCPSSCVPISETWSSGKRQAVSFIVYIRAANDFKHERFNVLMSSGAPIRVHLNDLFQTDRTLKSTRKRNCYLYESALL
ncbi:hypothetical protein L596_022325 [Steinernema carpocapsae]|uniref:Uncharacterized protein n=1 Tax=Steinernema carpocapsae TaxID=34508 RepID=A0A4U5MLH4_STECR|nr:hypothetical protein L596_022325 [Steinernema carpocapsae]